MKRKIYLTTRELLSEIKYETGLNTYESALVLESMMINEVTPASYLYDSMGDAMWDTVKQLLAERIIEALGYGHTKGTFIHTAVIKWVESIEFSQVQRYFSKWDEGGCEMWINSLLDTITETLATLAINAMIERIKQQVDLGEPQKVDPKTGDKLALNIDGTKVSNVFSEFFTGISIKELKDLAGKLIREKIFYIIFPEEKRHEVTALICDAMSDFSLSDFGSAGLKGITSGLGNIFGFGDDESGEE